MNGINNPLVFYPVAILIILFAMLAIKLKNIFYSLISAIIVFFLAGLMFYILGSEYNAIIQIAIYGVAVPVVLGLAVMFTNLKNQAKNLESSNLKYVLFLVSGIFILSSIYLVMTSLLVNPVSFNISEVAKNSSLQVLGAFSHGIFVKYVWAFELVSIILTMIVVGITLINQKEGSK